MGILRLLLALGVAADHTASGFFFTGLPIKIAARGMVYAFFVMSGFYMAMVFVERYSHTNNGALKFYQSRISRLFPVYIIVLLLSIILALLSGSISFGQWEVPVNEFIRLFNLMSIKDKLLLLIANLTGLFSDVLVHNGINESGVIANVPGMAKLQYILVINPPAWTLSIEIMFYMLVPLLLRWGRYNLLMLLIFYFCVVKTNILKVSYLHHFADNIEFFIYGCFAYFAYRTIKDMRGIKFCGHAALVLITTFMLLANFFTDINENVKSNALYYIVLFGIPFLFSAYGGNKYDRLIGMLSYPIYVSHFLVYKTLLYYMEYDKVHVFLLPALLLFSLILLFVVEMPVAVYRERNKQELSEFLRFFVDLKEKISCQYVGLKKIIFNV